MLWALHLPWILISSSSNLSHHFQKIFFDKEAGSKIGVEESWFLTVLHCLARISALAQEVLILEVRCEPACPKYCGASLTVLLYLKIWGCSRGRITRNKNRDKWEWRPRSWTKENGPVIKMKGNAEHSTAQHSKCHYSFPLAWSSRNHAHTQDEEAVTKASKVERAILGSFCGTLKVQAESSSGGVGSRDVDRGSGFFYRHQQLPHLVLTLTWEIAIDSQSRKREKWQLQ